MHWVRVICFCILLTGFAGSIVGQVSAPIESKKAIAKAADLPDFSYTLPDQVADVVNLQAAFAPLAEKLRADIEGVLRDYEIVDRATLKGLYSTLLELDLLEGKGAEVLEQLKRIRSLDEKAGALTYSSDGLVNESIALARLRAGALEGADYERELLNAAGEILDRYTWADEGRAIRRDARLFEMFSENFVLAIFANTVEAEAKRNNGTIRLQNASRAVSQRVLSDLILPSKEIFKKAISDYVARKKPNTADEPKIANIWIERDVTLTNDQNLTTVVIAVWDTGVDTSVYPDQLWTNPLELANDRDNDGNGFIADIHGVGLKNDIDKTSELLPSISTADKQVVSEEIAFNIGMSDFQAGNETPAAKAARERIESFANLKPEERQAFDRAQNLFHGYVHGTHVAGIAIKGNPAARLLTIARLFDFERDGRVPTTVEWSKAFAQRANELKAYLNAQHVRVVNMSFGDDLGFFETLLRENEIGTDETERRKLASDSFQIYRQAFDDLIGNSPEILFVCSAGNTDDDTGFGGRVPQTLDRPNLIAIGAVDRQGKPARFTNYGQRVKFYANGDGVESYIPGGRKMRISGTSQAAPQVANLAAKILALDPTLSVAEVVSKIQDGATASADGKMMLVHPSRSLALVVRAKDR